MSKAESKSKKRSSERREIKTKQEEKQQAQQGHGRHIIHVELKDGLYARFVALKNRLYHGVLVKDKPFAESLIEAGVSAREQNEEEEVKERS